MSTAKKTSPHPVRSVSLRRDLPTVPGASARALTLGLCFSSIALALRAESAPPALPPGPGTPTPDELGRPAPAPLAPGNAPRGRGELFFIDAAVADPRAFWLVAPAGATVVAIPAGVDSWEFMAAEADRFHDLGAIHLVSHGEPGALVLNGRRTTAADLASRAALLRRLGRALSKNGDILLYGCDTGAGDAGRMLVTRLADFTGADVAASANPTGALPGADWKLEITSGTIETPLAAPADYAHTLHIASVSTRAELVAAIAAAVGDGQDDTITLTADITLTAAQTVAISVSDGHKLTIVGGGHFISGGNVTRVFNIATSNAGSQVALQDLTISNGFLTGAGGNAPSSGAVAGGDAVGAAIRNTGNLALTGVTFSANKAAGGGGGAAGPGGQSGGGGGGGGFGTTSGAAGGSNDGYSAGSASAGQGGHGAGTNSDPGIGGSGGSSGGASNGGAGGVLSGGSTGGNGGNANAGGGISIGGGGGGGGNYATGARGGHAVAGLYNNGGTVTLAGCVFANNVAAGGGGGGGSVYAMFPGNGGAGGYGVAAIWNKTGTVQADASTQTSFGGASNVGGGGSGGYAKGGGGAPGADRGSNKTLGTIGTLVADSTPPTVLSIVRRLPSTAQATTSTSATFRVTFSEAVNAPTTANFAVAAVNGSAITGTIASVTAVSTSVYDVAVTITSGTGEFRLKIID